MNTSLRRVSMAVMALIVLLLLNATMTQVFTADGLRADPRNPRVLLDEYSRQRGQISAGGQLLAYSESTDGRFQYLRTYPEPLVYSPITGFYSLNYSSTGLERTEDPILNGSDERLFGRRIADFFTGRDPRGGSVDTTIKPQVQQAAWDAMAQGCGGPCTGAVVALEPSTGRILAMVSAPSYDPNLLASHDTDEQARAWEALRPNDPDSPLVNRATSKTYPPGSTFKVITTAAALTSGIPENIKLISDPSIELEGTTTTLENYDGFRCAGSTSTVSLKDAFAYSCNTAFVQLGLLTKVDPLRSTARAFGLDTQLPPIPLEVAQSTVGPIPDRAALAQTSIGQRDVALTPLQNALVAATVANGGATMQPYLVESLKGPDLATLSTTSPRELRRAVSAQVADKLTDLMVSAEQRTQGSGAVRGVQIASKTGTAEHGTDPRNTPPHAWYIAFAPADQPKIAVAVLVENERLNATGGTLAAPVGRKVIEAALREGS